MASRAALDRAYKKVRARRDAWFAEHGPCRRCGSSERLELHHRSPSEKVSHNIWSWSDSRRAVELAKCEALCSRCHDAAHARPVLHGRLSTYNKHGCRCDLCKAAKRVVMAKRNERRRLANIGRPREEPAFRDSWSVVEPDSSV